MDAEKEPVSPSDSEAPSKSLARSVGDLTANVVSLLELQARLGWEDLRTASRQATGGAACTVVAIGCALGGLPVLVFGVAELVVRLTGWPRWGAFLIFGSMALMLSSGLAYYGIKRVLRTLTVFRRSRDELIRNLDWLKTVAKDSWGNDGDK